MLLANTNPKSKKVLKCSLHHCQTSQTAPRGDSSVPYSGLSVYMPRLLTLHRLSHLIFTVTPFIIIPRLNEVKQLTHDFLWCKWGSQDLNCGSESPTDCTASQGTRHFFLLLPCSTMHSCL